MSIDYRELAIKIVEADKEQEVIDILRDAGFWDEPRAWRYYGDQENNFAEIGNQQSQPEAALTEKITNAVDAVLMRECLLEGLDPEGGPGVPGSIQEALEQFFGIPEGKLSRIAAAERRELADNICLLATGLKTRPCYSVIDRGEGQSPDALPHTILSLGKSNKLRIPFVQGRFNMGGTGVLQFCGERNLQTVLSRRHPDIAAREGDPRGEKWGFTVVRREDPQEGMRNSTFRYLAPNGKVPAFEADMLPLWPGDHPNAYQEPLAWGTLIKLYEYEMTGYRTVLTFDLYYRLSLLMPSVALPVRLYEMRDYAGHTLESTMSGLRVRLEEDTRKNLEDGFPTHHRFHTLGQTLRADVYAFREGAAENYKRNEGIVFTINGQTHGTLSQSFFSRQSVGLGYLEDSLLVIVDCTGMDGRMREDTFMNSRDRLRHSEFRSEVERDLEKALSEHVGLKELQNQRRKEAARAQLEDEQPLAEVLEDILSKSPTFSKLFLEGTRLSDPFDLREVATEEEEYEGKRFPTYFKLDREYPADGPKSCPVNVTCRVEYETDAENEYFGRDLDPGEFGLFLDGEAYSDYSLNLWNGHAYLNIGPPEGGSVGDLVRVHSSVMDADRVEPFEDEFYLRIEPKRQKGGGGKGGRKKSSKDLEGEGGKEPRQLALPRIYQVRKPGWDQHDFDEYSALRIVSTSGGYDFFVNVDNLHLLTEQKNNDVEPEVLRARYMYGMALLALGMLRSHSDGDERDSEFEEPEETSIEDKVCAFSRSVSPILLPMISALSRIGE